MGRKRKIRKKERKIEKIIRGTSITIIKENEKEKDKNYRK